MTELTTTEYFIYVVIGGLAIMGLMFLIDAFCGDVGFPVRWIGY